MAGRTKVVVAAWGAVAYVGGLVAYEYWRRRQQEEAEAEHPPQLSYGTAGFRADADRLTVAMERVGIVAALRSVGAGAATGVMVTASHNPVKDNGAKIVDTNGGMLAMSWESKAEAVAQCAESTLWAVVREQIGDVGRGGTVVIGRDTRPHSARLRALVRRGAERCGATVIDVGVVTTPQLHNCVKVHNRGLRGASSLYGYTDSLADAFKRLVDQVAPRLESRVLVDCAGGVGAVSVEAMALALRDRGLSGVVSLDVANRPGTAVLNEGCGAEFVQKQQAPPAHVRLDEVSRVASVDGDADRLVYCYADGRGVFRLLDGDKIATLLASFLAEELGHAHLSNPKPTFGVVQTAYANGAAAMYIGKALEGVTLIFAKTGVKFVHHAAEAFDIGVYFESNGHGTVLFSEATAARLAALAKGYGGDGSRRAVALRRLAAFASLANPVVGDAVADILLVEAVLAIRGESVADWDAFYEALPSRQLKQRVAARAVVKPNDDETRLVAPKVLQDAIDTLVHHPRIGLEEKFSLGTEDVVRVYAEASTQRGADDLARDVAAAVFDLAAGIGDRPRGASSLA